MAPSSRTVRAPLMVTIVPPRTSRSAFVFRVCDVRKGEKKNWSAKTTTAERRTVIRDPGGESRGYCTRVPRLCCSSHPIELEWLAPIKTCNVLGKGEAI